VEALPRHLEQRDAAEITGGAAERTGDGIEKCAQGHPPGDSNRESGKARHLRGLVTDREGFEPSKGLPPYRFSRPAPSATRTPVLQDRLPLCGAKFSRQQGSGGRPRPPKLRGGHVLPVHRGRRSAEIRGTSAQRSAPPWGRMAHDPDRPRLRPHLDRRRHRRRSGRRPSRLRDGGFNGAPAGGADREPLVEQRAVLGAGGAIPGPERERRAHQRALQRADGDAGGCRAAMADRSPERAPGSSASWAVRSRLRTWS
jgi:hypothetical protein